MGLHGQDPQFVPALAWDECRLLGFVPGHPFPEENEVQAWLAMRGETPIGRVAAVSNQHQHLQFKESCGHFGFFAAQNDHQVTTSLIQAAAVWVKQRGLQTLRGPFSPSINYSVGLLQNGFDREPSFQIPYNPDYYSTLLEAVGMRSVQDLYALEISQQQLLTTTPRLERIAERLSQRYYVNFRQLNPRKMKSELRLFLSIAQQSLQDHWGFVPLSERECHQLIEDLRWVVTPNMLQFAEIDGVAVGAALALPDLAPCIRQIRGRLLPLGFLKLWWAKRHVSRYRVVATNILPEYSRLGLAPALISRIFRNALNANVRSIEFSWIAESNSLSFGTIENGGAVRTKTLRIYEASCSELLAAPQQPRQLTAISAKA
jgi:GNAT superfamily N-acetyltransferase